MERSGTEVSSAPPTNPAGIRVGSAGPAGSAGSAGSGIPPARTAPSAELLSDPSLSVTVNGVDRASTDKAGTDEREGGRKRHWLGLTLLAVACCTVGATIGGALAVADHQAVTQQAKLAPLLADAAVDVQQVNSAAQPLDPARLSDLLQRVQAADATVAQVTTGRSWLIARTVTRRDALDDAADRAQGLSMLAAAAGPLRDSLTALQQEDAGDPDRLDALARDLNRFASVSLRAQQLGTFPARNGAAGTPFEQLATAAAVLPTMAGSEAPRSWTVCPASTRSCYRFTVQAGRVVGRGTVVRRNSGTPDIVIFGPAPRELVQGGRLQVQALLTTLVSMDSTDAGADDGSPVVTSEVPVEQHALDVIAKQGTRS